MNIVDNILKNNFFNFIDIYKMEEKLYPHIKPSAPELKKKNKWKIKTCKEVSISLLEKIIRVHKFSEKWLENIEKIKENSIR